MFSLVARLQVSVFKSIVCFLSLVMMEDESESDGFNLGKMLD